MSDTENSALLARDAAGTFPPGSGRRRRGTVNRATVLAEQLLEGDIEAVCKAIIATALDGATIAQS